jgi:hypothetical protein
MEKIYLDNEIICYKTKYIPLTNKAELISHLYKVMQPQKHNTGGYSIKNNDEIIKDIIHFGTKQCLELYLNEGKKYDSILYDVWINKVQKYDKQVQQTSIENPIFHNHKTINQQRDLFIPKYTFVYYVQMQDNLKGNEGHLLMKNKNGNIYSYLPKENDLIIMAGDCPHSPVPVIDTTKDRLIIGGNIGFKYEKKEKSLF